MGVITAPFTATEQRSLQLQIHNGPFDAIPVHDAPLSSTLGRRARRDKRKDSQDNPPPLHLPPPPKDMSGSSSSQNSDSDLCTYTHHHTHTTPCSLLPTTKGYPTHSTVSVMEGGSSADGPSTNSSASEDRTDPTSGFPSSSVSTALSDSSSTTVISSNTTTSSGLPISASQTSSVIPPSPLSVPTSTSSGEADANSSPTSTSSEAARVQSTGKAGPIAGGVIGGLVLILLFILGTILFLRRRRRKRTPASAEFRDRYIPRSHVVTPLAMQGSSEYLDDRDPPDAPPPPFTQGDYSDPLFEKIAETRQAHMQYGFTR